MLSLKLNIVKMHLTNEITVQVCVESMWMITEGCRCLCQNKFQTTFRWQKSCWSQRLTNGRGSANSGLKDLLTNQQRRGDPPL